MKISQAEQIVTAAIKGQMEAKARGGWRESELIIAYTESGAGVGKTTMKRKIADTLGLRYQPLCGVQFDVAELTGWALPIEGTDEMRRSKPEWWPDGSTPTLLHLDELPQSSTPVQNVFAQIVNESAVGNRKLPDNVYIVASGNRMSDKAGTNQMPTHLRDRLTFLPIEADVEDSIRFLSKVDGDERVMGYLRARPEFLHKFDRDQNACPSPRSWDRVSAILKFAIDPLCMAYAIEGMVGKEAAADFQVYLKVTSQMPDVDQIIASPKTGPIPTNLSILHAVCAALAKRMNQGNADRVIQYVERLPQQEFAAFVMKDSISRDPTLKQSNAVRQWVLTKGKELVL